MAGNPALSGRCITCSQLAQANCSAAFRSPTWLRAPDQANAAARGAQMHERLAPVCDASPHVAELRGKGLMQGLEFCHPGSIEPDAATTSAVLEFAKDRGLLVGKGGLYGNVIRITPMLSVTEAEMDEALDILVAAIEALD